MDMAWVKLPLRSHLWLSCIFYWLESLWPLSAGELYFTLWLQSASKQCLKLSALKWSSTTKGAQGFFTHMYITA